MKWRPQIMASIGALLLLGVMGMLLIPEQAELIVLPCVTGIGMLAMKLVGNEGE